MQTIHDAIQSIEVGWKSQKIRLVGTPVTKDDFVLLKRTLLEHPSVKSLEITLTQLNEDLVEEFAASLGQFSLIALQFVHTRLTNRSAKALAAGVQACSLKKLDLSLNDIGIEGALAIADSLRDCGLETLQLASNRIGTIGCLAIARVIGTYGTSLKILDLSRNDIRDEAAIALCQAMRRAAIESVALDSNGLTAKGIKEICEALCECRTLFHVSLGNNRLGDDSMVHIAKLIRSIQLERLDLHGSPMTDKGMEMLAKAIKDSNTLEVLNLKQCGSITKVGAMYLFDAIKCHLTMRAITTSESSISVQMIVDIRERLANLHSKKAKALIAMVAARKIYRVGSRSMLRCLDRDLFRRIGEMLPSEPRIVPPMVPA
jgi:Ran GTPase-activating protein (RanGAP) involved in mRNA processing and transport